MRVAPGGMPPQSQDPQQQQQQQPQQQQQQSQPGSQGPSPAQAIQMIEHGYMALGKLIQQAGGSLPPEDIQLFQQAAQATDALIQSLTGPAGDDQKAPSSPGKPSPGGPMPVNASPDSQGQPQG